MRSCGQDVRLSSAIPAARWNTLWSLKRDRCDHEDFLPEAAGQAPLARGRLLSSPAGGIDGMSTHIQPGNYLQDELKVQNVVENVNARHERMLTACLEPPVVPFGAGRH